MCVVFGLDLQVRWNSKDANFLLESLLSDAEAAILNQTFSRDKGTYRDFVPWEKEFICNAIMVSDPSPVESVSD